MLPEIGRTEQTLQIMCFMKIKNENGGDSI